MNAFQKILLIAAAAFVLIGTTACSADAETIPLDAELLRAKDAGLLPSDMEKDLDAVVLFSEYSEITRKAAELWDGRKVSQWEEIISAASSADIPMDVEDGILMLSYLWILMGQTEPPFYVINEWSEAPQEEKDLQISKLSWNYPYFPDWEVRAYEWCNSNYVWGAIQTFPMVQSPISNEYMIPYHSTEGMYYLQSPLSRGNGIRMLLRMLEACRVDLTLKQSRYIPVSEAGTYDQSIITDELLTSAFGMPSVSQSNLPEQWHGAGISARKSNADQYIKYSESDVRFLADNGFNFTRLFLSFETLGYPDYPDDPRLVNENELLELDQLLAWCLKYKVHLQISMIDYYTENGWNRDSLPLSAEGWKVTTDYWTMLARRYAGISSDYLTFDLCNEIAPAHHEDISAYVSGLSAMVEAVRETDSDRVLLYSMMDGESLEWAETLASLGLAIGCHPYKPHFITAADWAYLRSVNPYGRPIWPQPYFPIGNVMSGHARLTLTGDIGDSEITIHVWNSDANPSIAIYADRKEIDRLQLSGSLREDGQYYYGDLAYTSHVPGGVTEIQLEVVNEWARLDTIIIEKNGISTVMVPSDTIDYPDFSDPLPLIVRGDGSYTNSENLVYDEDTIYELAVKPYREIADRYGVGFMCNEFGIYGTDVHWDIKTVTAYHETYLRMMEKYNLGWSYCELFNVFPKHLIILYGNDSQWEGAAVTQVTYEYEDGRRDTLNVCNDLLETFRLFFQRIK